MRKIVCIFLILAFMLNLYSSYATNLNELQEQYNEVQNNINQANEELENVTNELTENLKQVQQLDEQISKTEQEIKNLDINIEDLQEQIKIQEEKLEVAKQDYSKQKEILENRLVAIYEAGEVQYIDIILSSTSFTNFLSNYFLISQVAQYDTDLLEIIEKEKNKIELATQKLELDKSRLETLKKNAQKTSNILQSTKALRQNYISKLSEEEQAIQKKIDEYNNQVNEIEAQIKQVTLNSISEEYIGGDMVWPIPGYTTITSKYGMRTHPITGVYKLHTGTDISAPIGANFVAMADGVVLKAEYNAAYGNMVIIDHGGGISSLYAHGSEIIAQVGQAVTKGDVVLKVGSTGYSTGPHAHFEIRVNGETVDPIEYLTTPKQ